MKKTIKIFSLIMSFILFMGVFSSTTTVFAEEYNQYIATKAELLPLLSNKHRPVLERSVELDSGIFHSFSDSFELLFTWCQETLVSLG